MRLYSLCRPTTRRERQGIGCMLSLVVGVGGGLGVLILGSTDWCLKLSKKIRNGGSVFVWK